MGAVLGVVLSGSGRRRSHEPRVPYRFVAPLRSGAVCARHPAVAGRTGSRLWRRRRRCSVIDAGLGQAYRPVPQALRSTAVCMIRMPRSSPRANTPTYAGVTRRCSPPAPGLSRCAPRCRPISSAGPHCLRRAIAWSMWMSAGAPVPSARFMGGREIELLAGVESPVANPRPAAALNLADLIPALESERAHPARPDSGGGAVSKGPPPESEHAIAR